MRDNPARIHEIEDVVRTKKITKQDIKRRFAYTVLSGVTLASAYFIGKELTAPYLQNELNVLKGTSSYLRSYEGNDPTKAIIYTKFSLEAAKNNPHIEGIGGLEDEVAKIESDIKTSTNKLVFKPVLNNIASRIDDIADYNKKPANFLFAYLGPLIIGALGYGFYSHGWLKREKK